jgi:hypothetical protein
MIVRHCHIFIYYTLVWFIHSIILLPTPFPFLKWLQQVSMLHIHICIESISAIFTLLYRLYLLFPSHWCPPLNMTCFTFLWWLAFLTELANLYFVWKMLVNWVPLRFKQNSDNLTVSTCVNFADSHKK